ncbi:MAG: hypothetical protein ACLSVD_15605 [Eggerthellaceae bacterium]
MDIIGKKMTIVGAGGAGSAIFTQAAWTASRRSTSSTSATTSTTRPKSASATLRRRPAATSRCDLDGKGRPARFRGRFPAVRERLARGHAADGGPVHAGRGHAARQLGRCRHRVQPRVTKLLAMAAEHGNKAVSGLGMLLWQAAIGENIWTGQEMPVGYIEEKFFAE